MTTRKPEQCPKGVHPGITEKRIHRLCRRRIKLQLYPTAISVIPGCTRPKRQGGSGKAFHQEFGKEVPRHYAADSSSPRSNMADQVIIFSPVLSSSIELPAGFAIPEEDWSRTPRSVQGVVVFLWTEVRDLQARIKTLSIYSSPAQWPPGRLFP